MKRRLLSLFVAFAMTISMVVVGAGAVEPTYGDTAGHWAENAIDRWSGHGVVQGSNGEFDPNGPLTCAQLATILAKLLKLPAAADAGFNDNAAGAWYYDAINRCAAAGILNGNGDGTVDPNGAISRERAMVMLGRALGIQPIENPDLTKFSDAAKVASYAQGMVAALIEKGIVGGVTSDTLAPQDDINRASTVTILDRAIGAYADKTGGVIKVEGTGIVIVVADDVTITGDVEQVIVPADNVDVTIRGCEDIDSITVTGENSKVILDNSSANDVTLDSKNTEIETKGNSKVDTVNVSEDAAGATVNAGSGTSIGSVENKAENTTVTGNGSVKEVASDKDMTVETKNTEVKNTGDEKISVTDKNGKTTETTAGGSSTTTGGSSGSSSGSSSHSHSYSIFETDWDTMATVSKCSCGATQAVENSSTYYVSNDTQLKAFREKVNAGDTFEGKTVKLTDDIDLNNAAWTPIGTSTNPFKGVFDGKGKTISNYSITAVDDNGSGLFGVIAGNENSNFMQLSDVVSENGTLNPTKISEDKYTCVVKNLKVSNATVTGGAGTEYVSPVIGAASNAYIANINVTDTTMTVYKYGAGIVAKLDKGVVNNCTTGGAFTGSGEGAGGHIAGIVAKVSGNAPFVVMDCTNNASITAQYGFNAGICGNVAAANSLIVYNCTNNGAISGTGANIIAGVVAHSQGGYYIGCNNTGVLSGTINDTDKGFGGIAGYITNYSHFFYNCTNTGNMSGATAPYVAGICGRSRQATTLYNCKNSGALPTSGTNVAQIMNLTDGQQLYMTITGEMTTEQMIAEISKVSGGKKAVTFAGTLSDTATLTLPADCESFTSATQTFRNVSLTNCAAVTLNIPGEYTLTELNNDKTVTIGGTNVYVIVPDTETRGGSIKLSGDNMTLTNNGTLNHVTFTGEANSTYTLNNKGTITYTTDAGNQHTVDSVGAARNITIHNRGTIESKSSGGTGSYAMLFYNGCTVAIHDYPGSVISAGERSETYKFISAGSTVSYYLHTAGESNDPEPIDMSSKYGTDLPSHG